MGMKRPPRPAITAKKKLPIPDDSISKEMPIA
jgi:hypothetical protein